MSDLIFSDSFINGEFYQTNSRFSVDDPATEQSIVDVSDIDEQGVKNAITAAKGAFVKLKATNATERSDTLMRWYELVIKHKQTLKLHPLGGNSGNSNHIKFDCTRVY